MVVQTRSSTRAHLHPHPANANLPYPISLLPVDLTKPHVIDGRATISPYMRSDDLDDLWVGHSEDLDDMWDSDDETADYSYSRSKVSSYIRRYFRTLFRSEDEGERLRADWDSDLRFTGDRSAQRLSMFDREVVKPIPDSNFTLYHPETGNVTTPDCTLYTFCRNGEKWFTFVWGIMEYRFMPLAELESSADGITWELKEGVYRMLWYCHMANALSGTRLGLAIVNEFFFRVVVNGAGTITVETTDAVLAELRAGGISEVAVGDLDGLTSFWETPVNSLLEDRPSASPLKDEHTWTLSQADRSRLDAATLSMLLAADPAINPFPLPSDSTVSAPSSSPDNNSTKDDDHEWLLADIECVDEDKKKAMWVAFRAMLVLNGVRIKLISREEMDVLYARGGRGLE